MILQIIDLTAIVLSSCLVVGAMWFFVCNQKTHANKIMVIELVRHRPMTAGALITAIRAVPYEKHLWALFFRRDPWKLYDPIVRDAIENPRTEVIGGIMMGERPDEAEKPPTVN